MNGFGSVLLGGWRLLIGIRARGVIDEGGFGNTYEAEDHLDGF